MLKKKLTRGLTGSSASIAISALFLLGSCSRTNQDISPTINYTVHDRYFKALPSAFPPLTVSEKNTQWGREYRIGVGFAKKLDLYRAITAFRRAEILVPREEKGRKLEMQYSILLCYYLGKRYQEVDQTFSTSDLSRVDASFPAFHDLLVILYDTYMHLEEYDRAYQYLCLIQNHDPKTYQDLILSSAMQQADFQSMEQLSQIPPEKSYLDSLLCNYHAKKKSPTTAALLNATIPGTGYFYLGQVQTGVTALFVNGLFIASSVYFFQNGPVAAGIIFASFEAGWYIGGIQGAAAGARFYNKRIYEQMATPIMNQEKLFPVFQLNYAF